jgi:SEC-C motif domain protein
MNACPCGSGRDFTECCGPILAGERSAPTAEALMRARYAAYVKGEIPFLGSSLSDEQRKDYSEEDSRRWAQQAEWRGLEVLRTEAGGEGDETGEVEFVARYTVDGEAQEHHEVALFLRVGKEWRYAGMKPMQGQTVRRETPKVGRNDPCPCGSGKKHKKCCGS